MPGRALLPRARELHGPRSQAVVPWRPAKRNSGSCVLARPRGSSCVNSGVNRSGSGRLEVAVPGVAQRVDRCGLHPWIRAEQLLYEPTVIFTDRAALEPCNRAVPLDIAGADDHESARFEACGDLV